MTLDMKAVDASLREIEELLLALLDAVEGIVGDPLLASSAATMLDFGLPAIYAKVVDLRAALRD